MRDHTYFQFIDPTDVANGLRASNDLFYLFYHLPQISQYLISSLLAFFICAKFTFPPMLTFTLERRHLVRPGVNL